MWFIIKGNHLFRNRLFQIQYQRCLATQKWIDLEMDQIEAIVRFQNRRIWKNDLKISLRWLSKIKYNKSKNKKIKNRLTINQNLKALFLQNQLKQTFWLTNWIRWTNWKLGFVMLWSRKSLCREIQHSLILNHLRINWVSNLQKQWKPTKVRPKLAK